MNLSLYGRFLAFALVICSACSSKLDTPITSVRLAVSEGFIPVEEDVELYYRMVGEGPDTLLMLHGGPAFGLNYFAPDLLPLATNYTLLFYDPRSAGRSTVVADTARVTEMNAVEDVEAVRRHFGLENVTLVAHSWGAVIAGLYGIQYPDRVDQMVLIGSSVPAWEFDGGIFQPLTRLSPEVQEVAQVHLEAWRTAQPSSVKACWDYRRIWIQSMFADPVEASNTWGDVCNAPQEPLLQPAASYQFVRMRDKDYDLREGLEGVTARTLILHGDEDPIPFEGAEAWAEALPNARLFAMPGSGHWPQVDRPEVFFPAVDVFLQGVWPDPPQEDGSWEAPENLPSRETTPYARFFREIEEAHGRLAVAISQQDWSAAVDMFADDALMLPPASSPIQGHEATAAYWEAIHDRGLQTLDLQTMEIEGLGENILEVGKYVVRNEEDNIVDMGKHQVIWRQEGGTWRIYRYTYNSSMETQSPLEVPGHLPPPTGTWSADGEDR